MRKYKNVKNNGYDSTIEYKRSLVLKEMEQEGIISNLQEQVEFELLPAINVTKEVQLKTKTKLLNRCTKYHICHLSVHIHRWESSL